MSDLREVDLYCAEAESLVIRTEGIVWRLTEDGACEGHRLMAAQGLKAIRQLDRIIQEHRKRLVFEVSPNAVRQPSQKKRTWWPLLKRRTEDDSLHA